MLSKFACPLCRTSISEDDSQYSCASGVHHFRRTCGIPDFSTRDHYWLQLTPDQMEFVLDVATLRGYRYAVERVVGLFHDSELARYILAPNRADFRAVLPMAPETEVLEIGSGWGAVTCTMAPHCRSVMAVDTNTYALRFVALRAAQEKMDNVSVACCDPLDDGRLPFAEDTFDLAVLNGVLEYVGSASNDVSPSEAQIRGLREVRRVLRPGGAIYVGIENRFGYLYFLGSRDHSGLRYTSIMPRWLASLATLIRHRKPYRTYTYSYAGYRALLAKAGFGDPKVYIAVPNYRDPRFIVPADDNRAIAYLVRRYASYLRRRSWRWAAHGLFDHTPDTLCGKLARWLSDSFLLVAQRTG